jgi:putative acetyltransferase
MKRMFVPKDFRGSGVGRALCDQVISEAREEGCYHSMRLYTGKRQTEAMRLYERAGFRRIIRFQTSSKIISFDIMTPHGKNRAVQ